MLSTIKRHVIFILAVCLTFTIFALMASAQQSTKKEGAKKGSSKSVTGCLQKGDEPEEFSLTAADGKTYGLRSSTVKLADHLGHKVTVSGTLKPEAEEAEEKGENEAKESKEGKENKEAGDIRVTRLKMVSETCK
jgi:hypothetical protein